MRVFGRKRFDGELVDRDAEGRVEYPGDESMGLVALDAAVNDAEDLALLWRLCERLRLMQSTLREQRAVGLSRAKNPWGSISGWQTRCEFPAQYVDCVFEEFLLSYDAYKSMAYNARAVPFDMISILFAGKEQYAPEFVEACERRDIAAFTKARPDFIRGWPHLYTGAVVTCVQALVDMSDG